MAVLTPANSPQPSFCEGCGGLQYITMRMVPCSTRHYRYLVMGMIKLRGFTVRAWVCDTCHNTRDAGTWYPEPPYPARPDIVDAIRRLKKAGHRFFDWEKRSETAP